MAVNENLTPQEQEELNVLLEKEALIRERIAEQNKKAATAQGKEKQRLENAINQENIRLKNNAQRITQLKKLNEAYEYEENIFKSISGVNEHIKKQINGQAANTQSLANVSTILVNLKKEEVNASEDDAKLIAARRETLESIARKTIDIAKESDAHHTHSETSAEKREKFQRFKREKL